MTPSISVIFSVQNFAFTASKIASTSIDENVSVILKNIDTSKNTHEIIKQVFDYVVENTEYKDEDIYNAYLIINEQMKRFSFGRVFFVEKIENDKIVKYLEGKNDIMSGIKK